MGKLKIKNLKKLRKVLGVSAVLTTLSLTGCTEQPYIEDAENLYYTIDSNKGTLEISPQEERIEGEDFKLIVEYYLDDDSAKKWRITDNKELYTKVYTKDLPEDTKVWIDNIHTDTTIVSSKEEMNGIPQDSMDDHTHNSLSYGFPISNTVSYHGLNVIEGQNDDFISGSSYGFEGYSSESITQRRHSESEYLENGVYANKISSAFDLWVQKGDEEPYMTTASSDIVVLAYNIVAKKTDTGTIKYYQYDHNGESKEIEAPKEKVKTK